MVLKVCMELKNKLKGTTKTKLKYIFLDFLVRPFHLPSVDLLERSKFCSVKVQISLDE